MWLPLYLMIIMLLSLMISMLASLYFNTTSEKENLIPKLETYYPTQWLW